MVERASATTWELVYKRTGALLAFLSLFNVTIALCNGAPWQVVLLPLVLVGFFVLLMDYLAYSKLDLTTIHFGQGVIVVHATSVHPDDIISIRSISYSRGRNVLPLVEFVFRSAQGEGRAIAPDKPTWFWRDNSPTIDLLVEHFPQLKDRVLAEYHASKRKEVVDPSTRTFDPPFPDPPPSDPAARYRDPYFRRRRT